MYIGLLHFILDTIIKKKKNNAIQARSILYGYQLCYSQAKGNYFLLLDYTQVLKNKITLSCLINYYPYFI